MRGKSPFSISPLRPTRGRRGVGGEVGVGSDARSAAREPKKIIFFLLFAAIAVACGSMKDPGTVADKFVDKYYVESDQQSALQYTTGVASMRLKDELGLTAEARRGNTGMTMRQ